MKIFIIQKKYHSRCFFLFAQMIRAKLGKLNLYKKIINTNLIEIIRNIEMLCFLDLKEYILYKNYNK